MNDRFEVQEKLMPNQYTKGVPVLISAGQLLKDSLTGRMSVQVRLQNIGPEPLYGIDVLVQVYDYHDTLIESVDYRFDNITLYQGDEIGQDELIQLEYEDGVSVDVFVTGAELESGEYLYAEEMHNYYAGELAPLSEYLGGNAEMVKQFRIRYGDRYQYKPVKTKEMWFCACGAANLSEDAKCRICGIEAEELFNLDLNELADEVEARAAEEAAEKAKKAAEAKKKAKKIGAIAAAVVILICAGLGVKHFVFDASKVETFLESNASIRFYGMDGHGWYEVSDFDPSLVEVGKKGADISKFIKSLDAEVNVTKGKDNKLSNGDEVEVRLVYDKAEADRLGLRIQDESYTATVEGLGERFEDGYDIPYEDAEMIMKRLKKEALYTASLRDYGDIDLAAVYFMKDTSDAMEYGDYAFADGVAAFFSYVNKDGFDCYFYERIRPVCMSTDFDLLLDEYDNENKEKNYLFDNTMGSDDWKEDYEVYYLEDAVQQCEEHENNVNYDLIELDYSQYAEFFLD